MWKDWEIMHTGHPTLSEMKIPWNVEKSTIFKDDLSLRSLRWISNENLILNVWEILQESQIHFYEFLTKPTRKPWFLKIVFVWYYLRWTLISLLQDDDHFEFSTIVTLLQMMGTNFYQSQTYTTKYQIPSVKLCRCLLLRMLFRVFVVHFNKSGLFGARVCPPLGAGVVNLWKPPETFWRKIWDSHLISFTVLPGFSR